MSGETIMGYTFRVSDALPPDTLLVIDPRVRFIVDRGEESADGYIRMPRVLGVLRGVSGDR